MLEIHNIEVRPFQQGKFPHVKPGKIPIFPVAYINIHPLFGGNFGFVGRISAEILPCSILSDRP